LQKNVAPRIFEKQVNGMWMFIISTTFIYNKIAEIILKNSKRSFTFIQGNFKYIKYQIHYSYIPFYLVRV
jgi:hypothetical protein